MKPSLNAVMTLLCCKDDCPECASGSFVAINKLEKTAGLYTGGLDGLEEWLAATTKPTIITFGE